MGLTVNPVIFWYRYLKLTSKQTNLQLQVPLQWVNFEIWFILCFSHSYNPQLSQKFYFVASVFPLQVAEKVYIFHNLSNFNFINLKAGLPFFLEVLKITFRCSKFGLQTGNFSIEFCYLCSQLSNCFLFFIDNLVFVRNT